MTMKPNLIIGGTPKSGTSSIYDWLAVHPSVTGSVPKETFFLMDKDNPMLNQEANVHDQGANAYGTFFPNNIATPIIFEATTHYLYQQTALKFLASLDPVPYVFFILRKPSDRIYSSFEYTKNNRAAIHPDFSFSLFVSLLLNGEEHLIDKYITSEQSRYVLKRDLQYSNYYQFLQRWANDIPEEKLHIFLFEDIVKHPHRFMTSISSILNIDGSFYDSFSFEKKNETYGVKSHGLHKIATNYTQWIPKGPIKKILKKSYLAMQSKAKISKQVHHESLRRLDLYFDEPNAVLRTKFQLDLSAWDQLSHSNS